MSLETTQVTQVKIPPKRNPTYSLDTAILISTNHQYRCICYALYKKR